MALLNFGPEQGGGDKTLHHFFCYFSILQLFLTGLTRVSGKLHLRLLRQNIRFEQNTHKKRKNTYYQVANNEETEYCVGKKDKTQCHKILQKDNKYEAFMKMIFDQVAQFLQKGVNMITREGKLLIVPSQKVHQCKMVDSFSHYMDFQDENMKMIIY